MDDKLIEALDAVVKEIQSLPPAELRKALIEASKSEFAQTIDTINHFTSTIRYNRSEDGDTLSLFLPIENKPVIPKTDTENLPNTELYLKLPIER